ncbi:MAG: TonB-dependent receptor [Gemmatimonadetes bacterium]|nr:TonB-dependent receptor [Gemmatimonadota bacterium]
MILPRRLGGLLAALIPVAAQAQNPLPDSARGDSLARYTLAPIDVTVTRSATDLSRLPFAVHVITGDDIGKGRPRLGLDEALAGVPGVLATSRQNYALDQTLSIRGFGSRSAFGVRGLKILLDGVPQTLPDGQGQLTNVDLDDVERAEILRGSASSLYGNASGGVISLSTAGERPARIAPTVRVLGGAYGLVKYRAGMGLPVGRGSLSVSGVRTQSDGFRDHSNADLWQGRTRLALPLGSQTLMTILGQVAHDPTIKDPGALTFAEMGTDPTLANPLSKTRDAGKDVSQEQASVTLVRHFPGGATANVTGFGLRRKLKNRTTATYIELGRWAYGARGSAGLPVVLGSRTALLTAGADAQWQRDDRINKNVALTALTRDQLERVAELGPFFQASFEAMPFLTLSVGARYDWVRFSVDDRFLTDGDDSGSRLMSALSGSAGIATHGLNAFAPYANVSTSFETPTTTELANRPTGPGGFNPDLDPQKAVNYEVGFRGGAGAAGARLDYSVALYRADVRGELIPFEVPGDPGRRFFRNAGSSRHQGVEIGLGARLLAGLSLRGGYTYSHHRFVDYRTATAVFDGLELPGVPAHYFKGTLTARFGEHGWVSLEQAVSSSYFVNDANTTRNAGWSTTAMRPGVALDIRGFTTTLFGGIENLFNQRYAASVQVNAANGRFFEPSPGRNGYIGIELRPAR